MKQKKNRKGKMESRGGEKTSSTDEDGGKGKKDAIIKNVDQCTALVHWGDRVFEARASKDIRG
jgi:hypothetical protein